MGPDPELAIDAVGKELGFSAVVFGHEEQVAMPTPLGLENQGRTRFDAVARQICEVARRTKPERRIVGADSLAPGRQDEIDAGVGLREGLAARRKPRGFGMALLGDRPVDPLARHELDERLRRREVVASLCWGDGLLEILFGRHGSTKIR